MIRARSLAAALLLACVLTGCHAPPPPAQPPPLPVPPPAPPEPAAASARWSFAVDETACVAHASARDMSLTVSVGANRRIELTVAGSAVRLGVTRGGMRGRLRFEGVGGRWALPARSSRHRAVQAFAPLNATTSNEVLKLLGGGRLYTGVGNGRVPVLHLPDSDVAGRGWFGCVRNELGETPQGG